jgi:uncharacterized membrane protein YtjA (UPF0391 family)
MLKIPVVLFMVAIIAALVGFTGNEVVGEFALWGKVGFFLCLALFVVAVFLEKPNSLSD